MAFIFDRFLLLKGRPDKAYKRVDIEPTGLIACDGYLKVATLQHSLSKIRVAMDDFICFLALCETSIDFAEHAEVSRYITTIFFELLP